MTLSMLMVRMMHFEVFWADLNPVVGREQAGHRPVLVISNDIENQMDIVTVVPVTSRKKGRRVYPNEVAIKLLGKEAILLCHQIRTISKKRLGKSIELIASQNLQQQILNTLCMRFESI